MIFIWILILKLMFIVCYVVGGQKFKWLKSIFSPLVYGGGLILLWIIYSKFNWLSCVGAALYIVAANWLSYGDKNTHDILWRKILFRGLIGAGYGLCAFLIALGFKNIWYGVGEILFCVTGSIFFGVYNPFPQKWGNKAAMADDAMIALNYMI